MARLAERRLNPENGANLFAAAGAAYRSRRAIGAWPTHAGPAGAGQGRQPAEPGARSASLDRRRLVRHRLDTRLCLGQHRAHCADLLSAKENPDSCNVRRCRKNCDKSLHCHTTDRGAPCAFYPAIRRSASPASSVVRHSSTNCVSIRSAEVGRVAFYPCSRSRAHVEAAADISTFDSDL